MRCTNVEILKQSFCYASLAIRFAPTNSSTDLLTGSNVDISCGTDLLCSAPYWTDGIRPTALNLSVRAAPPPVKDTVIVPANGYTVIRFRTDNPGFWLMHCHMETHAIGCELVY